MQDLKYHGLRQAEMSEGTSRSVLGVGGEISCRHLGQVVFIFSQRSTHPKWKKWLHGSTITFMQGSEFRVLGLGV